MSKRNGREALSSLLDTHFEGRLVSELERNRVNLDEELARLASIERQLELGKYEKGPKTGQSYTENRLSALRTQARRLRASVAERRALIARAEKVLGQSNGPEGM